MARTIDLSGAWLVSLFYAVSLAAFVPLLLSVALPLDPGGLVLTALLLSLLGAALIGLWRRRAGRDGEHLGTDEDLAYDPIAYPGQAAKHSWAKAVRRLPGGGDEGD
ncbi:hypothetical protein [Haloarcula litorea]|uniref:hypothetical protein n=1 Tax=Haloarcula litorea TaxID=3032579 RepID=UPI0023E8D964|nr:hypothetical protein [Halomicroarcula sp. GDY20]